MARKDDPRTEKVTRRSDGETFTVTPEVRDALLQHPDDWELTKAAARKAPTTKADGGTAAPTTPAPEAKKES